MVSIEVEARLVPLVEKFLNKVQGLQNGDIKVIFRDGQPERIDRSEWELTRSRTRPVPAAVIPAAAHNPA